MRIISGFSKFIYKVTLWCELLKNIYRVNIKKTILMFSTYTNELTQFYNKTEITNDRMFIG